MPVKLLHSIRALFRSSRPQVSCYHCGENSPLHRTVYVQFEGESRAVCCNGCAAILKTVAELGMCDEYRAHNTPTPPANER